MICALIMAGGKGTRFWPLSTEEKPKQFLKLLDEKTMIQMTVDRISKLIPIERIFVCTGEQYIDLVRSQLPILPERNIIVEPDGRNTTPCIALSALVIERYYKEATMVVLPSDHLISDEEKFLDIIKTAGEFINKNEKSIITLGMNPTRPETGYGYIRFGNEENDLGSNRVVKVEEFVEKPDIEKANEYLRDGKYLWNGGMFVWKVSNILNQIKKYSPNTFEALSQIESISDENLQEIINKNYNNTDSISIDYSVLEKSDDIYVIPSDIGWDDVGSWEAIERYSERDILGNIHRGVVTSIDSKNNLIITSKNQIIIDDISDIYVIENDGKIIIGKKNNISNIKNLKNII